MWLAGERAELAEGAARAKALRLEIKPWLEWAELDAQR